MRTGGGGMRAGFYMGEKNPKSRDRRRGRLSENARKRKRRLQDHRDRAKRCAVWEEINRDAA